MRHHVLQVVVQQGRSVVQREDVFVNDISGAFVRRGMTWRLLAQQLLYSFLQRLEASAMVSRNCNNCNGILRFFLGPCLPHSGRSEIARFLQSRAAGLNVSKQIPLRAYSS